MPVVPNLSDCFPFTFSNQRSIPLKQVGKSCSHFVCSFSRQGERLHKVFWLNEIELWLSWHHVVPIVRPIMGKILKS